MWFSYSTFDSCSTWYRHCCCWSFKKLLQMAGVDDCYTSACGTTATVGNFAMATYMAIAQTYSYLTPDMWTETQFAKSPYQEYTDYLAKNHTPGGAPAPA